MRLADVSAVGMRRALARFAQRFQAQQIRRPFRAAVVREPDSAVAHRWIGHRIRTRLAFTDAVK